MNRRKRLLAAQPLCVHCLQTGRIVLAIELDHITPLAKGGSDTDDNLQPLCAACHTKKTRTEAGCKPKQAIGLDGYPIEE